MRYWTEGETEQAKQLYLMGRSARQIGHKLFRTRESVIGRMYRIGVNHPAPHSPKVGWLKMRMER